MVDMVILGDSLTMQKETEKLSKYQDLKIEVQRLWERKVDMVPIVVGALGAIPKDLHQCLKSSDLDKVSLAQIQKAALLLTAHIQ